MLHLCKISYKINLNFHLLFVEPSLSNSYSRRSFLEIRFRVGLRMQFPGARRPEGPVGQSKNNPLQEEATQTPSIGRLQRPHVTRRRPPIAASLGPAGQR